MFFDEELEKIVTDMKDNPKEMTKEVVSCIKRRLPNIESGVQNFLNDIRKMDSGWQLFCKRHPEFKINGFRDLILSRAEDDNARENIKKVLRW